MTEEGEVRQLQEEAHVGATPAIAHSESVGSGEGEEVSRGSMASTGMAGDMGIPERGGEEVGKGGDRAVDWEKVIKEVEEGKGTPAEIGRRYGFQGWADMLRKAPPEVATELRRAKFRALTRRKKQKQERGKQGEQEKDQEVRQEKQERQEAVEKKSDAVEEVAREKVEKVKEGGKEEKGSKEEKKEDRRLWMVLAGVALAGVVFWLLRRRRVANGSGGSERQERLMEESTAPVTPKALRNWREEYRV